MINSSRNVLDWIERTEKIPVWKKEGMPDVDDFYENTYDGMAEIEDAFEKYSGKGFFVIDMKFVKNEFINDVKESRHCTSWIYLKWVRYKSKYSKLPVVDETNVNGGFLFKEFFMLFFTLVIGYMPLRKRLSNRAWSTYPLSPQGLPLCSLGTLSVSRAHDHPHFPA